MLCSFCILISHETVLWIRFILTRLRLRPKSGASGSAKLIFLVCFLNLSLYFCAEKRRHGEGSEARRRADKIFGISHGVSNLVNLAGLAANLAYFYILAHRIGGCW